MSGGIRYDIACLRISVEPFVSQPRGPFGRTLGFLFSTEILSLLADPSATPQGTPPLRLPCFSTSRSSSAPTSSRLGAKFRFLIQNVKPDGNLPERPKRAASLIC